MKTYNLDTKLVTLLESHKAILEAQIFQRKTDKSIEEMKLSTLCRYSYNENKKKNCEKCHNWLHKELCFYDNSYIRDERYAVTTENTKKYLDFFLRHVYYAFGDRVFKPIYFAIKTVDKNDPNKITVSSIEREYYEEDVKRQLELAIQRNPSAIVTKISASEQLEITYEWYLNQKLKESQDNASK